MPGESESVKLPREGKQYIGNKVSNCCNTSTVLPEKIQCRALNKAGLPGWYIQGGS